MTNTTYRTNELAYSGESVANTPSPKHERIIVFLDGTPEAERAIAEAIKLAGRSDARVVLIGRSYTGAEAYINEKVAELHRQHVNAHGYTISDQAAKAPAWIVKTEKADAVVLVQGPVNWLSRLMGTDLAASLRARTSATVYSL